jgi:PAS domain S-box-containing protein
MSEGTLDDTFVHAAVGIAHHSPDLVITEANPKLCTILGYERAELIGRATRERLLPEDRAELDPIPDLLRRGGLPPFPIERQYLRKDGSTVWLLVTGAFVPGPDARPGHLVCYYHDISDRKRADRRVAESEARFRSYFEHAPIAVLVHDSTGRYIDSNPAARALLGYDAEEILNLDVTDTRTADDQQRWEADLASVDALGVVRIERALKRRDSSLVQIEICAVKIA